MAWYYKAALGGGFGGTDHAEWELCRWAENEDNAMSEAEEAARQEYESYGGSHGLFDEDEYREENPDADDDEVELEHASDMDSWIEYEAQWFDTNPNEEE